jgi:hypothetical protein
MNSGLAISLAIFCFFFAAVLFSISYVQLRKKHWPLIEGLVIAQRYRRSYGSPDEYAGQNHFDASNERIAKTHDIKIILRERHYELSFENLPSATVVGDKLLVHVHPVLPQLFHCLQQKTESYSIMYYFQVLLMVSLAAACIVLGLFFVKLA